MTENWDILLEDEAYFSNVGPNLKIFNEVIVYFLKLNDRWSDMTLALTLTVGRWS